MIELRNVSFSYYGNEPLFRDLTMTISPGLTMLLGPNGCGKSTFLKIAAGVEKPDAGSVDVDGRDLWKDEVRARARLAYLPEQPDLTPYATVREILNLVCRLRGEPLSRAESALDFFGLKSLSNRTVRELSMGQRRRAVFSALLIGRPDNILIDEPLAGMDRAVQKKILEWISRRRESGASIVVVSHAVAPFRDMVSAAWMLRDHRPIGGCDLPRDRAERTAMLDAMARGEIPPGFRFNPPGSA